MNNLGSMHILAGTTALVCILWNFLKIIEAFEDGWQNGASLLSTLAIGGYLLGCVIKGITNLILYICKREKQK